LSSKKKFLGDCVGFKIQEMSVRSTLGGVIYNFKDIVTCLFIRVPSNVKDLDSLLLNKFPWLQNDCNDLRWKK
jgi:hypothetical protein